MRKIRTITEEQLDQMPKEMIAAMYVQLSNAMEAMIAQNDQMLKQIESLKEQIAVLTQQLFGRKTERNLSALSVNSKQLMIDLDTLSIINEAEYINDNSIPEEPDIETVIVTKKRKKSKGKREADLKYVESVIDEHYLSEEALTEMFPNGYDRLPDDVYSDLEYVPEKFIKHEHHIGVYAGKHEEGIVRGDKPERLLQNSILTPGLAAAIFSAKYVNAVPLNRLSEEFARHDVNISRQTMAGWMIRLADRYLGIIYNAMRERLLKSKLIHCDETPFKLVNDGRGPNSKNYMWVYHSYERCGTPPIYIYEYEPTRSTDVIRKSLKDFKGVLVTDGYEAYHTLAKERPDDLKVAGCWAHAKRRFAELAKAVGKKTANGSVAVEANDRISAIYHVDNMTKQASDEERMKNRQSSVKPLVDAYFAWLRSFNTASMDKSGKLYKAIQYSLNQERYLRAFLDDPMIPMDNNDAERSIKKFCVGKHSWHIIATPGGAKSSALLYSIAETAKANGLKPFEYFKYLLEGILEHLDDPPSEYIEDLLPWSDRIPEICRKKITED